MAPPSVDGSTSSTELGSEHLLANKSRDNQHRPHNHESNEPGYPSSRDQSHQISKEKKDRIWSSYGNDEDDDLDPLQSPSSVTKMAIPHPSTGGADHSALDNEEETFVEEEIVEEVEIVEEEDLIIVEEVEKLAVDVIAQTKKSDQIHHHQQVPKVPSSKDDESTPPPPGRKSAGPSPVPPPSRAPSSSSPPRPKLDTTNPVQRSNSTSSGGSRRRRRRKLQWKKSVRVHVIPNLAHFSEQEKKNTWYQAEEYAVMEDECDLTSEMMDSNKPMWPGFCGRGLESWTREGEHRKEHHVQMAIDIVWQAQLDQWRQASNTDECWEFIRSQYMRISKLSLNLASQMAQEDERAIQSYLSSVKALEKSRRKMLGIRSKSGSRAGSSGGMLSGSHHNRRAKVGRTVSDTTNVSPVKSPRRTLSDGRSPSTPSRPILRPALKYTDVDEPPPNAADSERTPKIGSKARKTIPPSSSSSTANRKSNGDDDESNASLGSSRNHNKKKIEFKSGSKSKTKIPTSPVGSLCSSYAGTEDSSSTMRRMRSSHLSVSSDESTRRRMLRTAGMNAPL